MNHFSLNFPPSDTLWYTPMDQQQQQQQQQQQPLKSFPLFYHNCSYDDADSDNSSSNNNAANASTNDRSETASSLTQHPAPSSTTTAAASTAAVEKEQMFEKPLTPSDVGKLNRLVIPKQHAEKYFPLAGVSAVAGDSDKSVGGGGGGGGLLLGFEDEGGKCWRFRYSYWNSSQSYVLTKGWSRYVKEKKLDAGDVVLFERHRFDPDRFFIGWRRRGSPPVHHSPVQTAWAAGTGPRSNNHHHHQLYNYYNHNHNHNVVQRQQHPSQQVLYAASHPIAAFPYQQPDSLHAGEVRQERKKGKKSGGNPKSVRLFGVNLECQHEEEEEDEPQTSDGSSLSSQGQGQGQGHGSRVAGPTAYNYFDYVGYPPTSNHHNHMDINYPQDVNQQMRNRLG